VPGTPEPQAGRDRLRQRLAILLPQVRQRLLEAGVRYKRYADRRAVAYDPDNLEEKRVALRRDVSLQKLEPHGLGLYQVVAAGDHTDTMATVKGPVKISKDRILQAIDGDRPVLWGVDPVHPPPSRDSTPGPWLPKILDQYTHAPNQRNAPNVPFAPIFTRFPVAMAPGLKTLFHYLPGSPNKSHLTVLCYGAETLMGNFLRC
jgi:hypothetical protein